MTVKRGVFYGVIVAVLLAGLLYLRRTKDHQIDTQNRSQVLAPSESAKILIDPRRHTITTVTRKPDGGTETKATFLPPGGASISLEPGNRLRVTSRSWGTEINPFAGLAFGSDLRWRAALGVNGFYIRQWELGGGLLLSDRPNDARAFVHVSFNPVDSFYVSAGIDNRQTLHLMTGLKF